jgi:antitoxin PrlF
MRITSKGQVTIPQEIRERFGFLPETQVEFVVKGGAVILRKPPGRAGGRGAELVRRMRGRGTVRMSTSEILALTRKER